ncbi:MAG: peptidase [Proteobacteria bacterium]|nr:peptidase [Pseudomonadota bacterium]
MKTELRVALGDGLYGVERPWGALPATPGRITDLAVGEDGLVHVLLRRDSAVDPQGPCVVTLATDGRFIRSGGEGLCVDAHKIATTPDGGLAIVDRDAHRIFFCDPEGRIGQQIGESHRPGQPFNHPSDIAFAPDGDFYVADGYGNGRIHRFDAKGNLITSWGSVGTAPGAFLTPHGICVLSDGRVIVADRENSRVQSFTAEGELLAVWDAFLRPQDVVADAEDRILVCDSIPTLSQLSAEGTLLGRCRPVLNGAHGLWLGPAGDIFLAETNPNRITRLFPVAG